MTTSVNKGERRPRLRETGTSHDWLSKIILPGEHSVPWRAKCEGEKQTKHKKKPRCVHNSSKVVTFLGLYNHMWIVMSIRFPPFCDLNFSPKNSYIHFSKISALLPFTLNATEIMTFFEQNRNIIFKKRSIDLVKARCRESNTSRQSSSQFLPHIEIFFWIFLNIQKLKLIQTSHFTCI